MRSPLFILALVALAACDAPPVDWDPTITPAPPGSRLVVDSAGKAGLSPDSAPTPSIAVSGVCLTSVRAAWGTTRLRAVWWGVRADSSAVLYLAASSDSGHTWESPTAVDTADVSTAGCGRPPPSIAAAGDDVHIAYSMTASEGTGVFFAHFLATMLHSPVAVIYGDRLVPTAVAVEGDRVAVAYEDPNGRRRQVGIALSTTQGHIFEVHTVASRDIDVATDPLVAIADHRIAVSWLARQAPDSAATRVIRRGRIQ